MVRESGIGLVVIDPLMAHLKGSVDSWKDQSIRGALAPLARLAESNQTAVLLVCRLNKGQSVDPLRRLGGSIGIAAAARSVMLLANDPDDPDGPAGSRRVLAHVKSNLSELAESLLYVVEPQTVKPVNEPMKTVMIRQLGSSPYRGAELLAASEEIRTTAVSAEVRSIREQLDEGPKLIEHLQTAADAAGLDWPKLERAKGKAGAASAKQRNVPHGPWFWYLTDRNSRADVDEAVPA
jgi:hypothetical protein